MVEENFGIWLNNMTHNIFLLEYWNLSALLIISLISFDGGVGSNCTIFPHTGFRSIPSNVENVFQNFAHFKGLGGLYHLNFEPSIDNSRTANHLWIF